MPLGSSKCVGVVMDHCAQSSFDLKPILKSIDREPIVGEDILHLSKWMSNYYHYPLGQVLEVVLPSAARRGSTSEIGRFKVWHALEGDVEQLKRRAPRQYETWELLHERGPLSDAQLTAYRVDRQRLKALAEKGLVETKPLDADYKPRRSAISLTEEQELAVNTVCDTLGEFSVHLLYGITGSGKTEVYLQLIDHVLKQGQQALILVPEIALIPQTVDRIRNRFGNVASMHSKAPAVARFQDWLRCGTGEHRILVGTRSAVFTPFANLGLIVVDEEHDTSYKQHESLRYSARDVAIMRAQRLRVPCVLGSATPSTETLHNVRQRKFRMSRLSIRPGAVVMPTFNILDIRGHDMRSGLSVELLARMREHLAQQSQVLLLINRRGYAPTLLCTECIWRCECQDCDAKLTLHEYPIEQLRCHHCGAVQPIPEHCPNCGAGGLVAVGTGTQRIDAAIAEEFPDFKIYRIDRDAISTRRKIDRVFREIRDSRESILIGTQMLSKGHHFPNVTMVVIIDADRGFLSADFRAPERTAQLIMQVAGRAGRAEKPGEVWIQTFDPENQYLDALVRDGYDGFMKRELASRQEAEFPPYTWMAVIRAESEDMEKAQQCVGDLLDKVRWDELDVLGPGPAPVERIAKRWRFQGAILSRSRAILHGALGRLEKAPFRLKGVRWSIDVDPSDMF